MAIDYDIYLGDGEVIDPLGSVVVNLNATGSPFYQWLDVSSIKAYGTPTESMNNRLPHKDSVSYRIKHFDSIFDPINPEGTVGDSACLTDPTGCSGRGPFKILGRKYFIDYMFLYFVNTGDTEIFSPMYSIDGSLCDHNYGYFVGTPSVPVGTLADTGSLLLTIPDFTSDLSKLDDNIFYKFTTRDSEGDEMSGNLTPTSILTLVQAAIEYGQGIVVSENSGSGLTLQPGEFHPLVLFRYVSENAPTRPLNINFRYGPTI